MHRALKVLAVTGVMLALSVASVLGLAWWSSEMLLGSTVRITDPPLPRPDAAAVAHGKHLYRSRGCSDCHGERGEGRLLFDAVPARVMASNLTPAGRGRHYDLDTLGQAIRHGVAHDGRLLRFMPVDDYAELSDSDTAALAGYLLSLPAVEPAPGSTRIHLVGRLLHLFGQLELAPARHVDHRPRQRAAPVVAASVEYGAYLARTCASCHGSGYRGGRVPGTPPHLPAASDLTAMHGWRARDFMRLMREGIRPDASLIHPLMPWQAFRTMTDTELSALWLYFRSLPGPSTEPAMQRVSDAS